MKETRRTPRRFDSFESEHSISQIAVSVLTEKVSQTYNRRVYNDITQACVDFRDLVLNYSSHLFTLRWSQGSSSFKDGWYFFRTPTCHFNDLPVDMLTGKSPAPSQYQSWRKNPKHTGKSCKETDVTSSTLTNQQVLSINGYPLSPTLSRTRCLFLKQIGVSRSNGGSPSATKSVWFVPSHRDCGV